MALSTLQKLLQKPPPAARILASLHTPHIHLPNPTPPFIFAHENHHLEPKPSEYRSVNGSPFLDSFRAVNLTRFVPSPFAPICPIGFASNPIWSTELVQDGANDDEGMLADSVKKKRKKKMNKHKYKKLRKRLRRQT